MAKGPSKANLILMEARQRLSVAQQNVETAEGQLGIARAALNAHRMAYDALEKALAPKPRKKAAQSQPAQLTDKKEKEAAKADAPKSNDQLCTAMVPGLNVECGEPEENRIHDITAGYASYHPFESSAPVAEKRSRRKGVAASSIPSTETNSENVLAAGAGGD